MNNIWKLVVSLAIPQLAGAVGSLFTFKSVGTWYQTINKPNFNPPNWVFGPVWTGLFLLMGISFYLVWTKENVQEKQLAYWVFAIQLGLNVFWSVLFFGMRSSGLALVEIFVLWVAILANIFVFWKISPVAGILLVPYVLWVSFAAFLNYSIWKLN